MRLRLEWVRPYSGAARITMPIFLKAQLTVDLGYGRGTIYGMTANSRWTCPQCSRPYRLQIGAVPPEVCPSCEKVLAARRSASWEQQPIPILPAGDVEETEPAELDAAAARVLLATSNRLDGHQVEETLQLIAVERVSALYGLKDLVASPGEIVSGRVSKVEGEIKKLRESCLRALRREAVKCRANAVFAVQISCTELSAGRSLPMIMMIASGTAARVTRTDDTVNF